MLQLLIAKGQSKVLPVDGEGERALVHIEKDAEDPLAFEGFAVVGSLGVGVVPERADAEEGPAVLKVTERGVLVLFPLGSDACFDLVL